MTNNGRGRAHAKRPRSSSPVQQYGQAALTALALASGCIGAPPAVPTFGGSEASTSATGDSGSVAREVDIIFVVDNSSSMGEEQGALATAIEELIEVLDGATPPVDYRIAVTTTDDGNPWCVSTEPEEGSFVSLSCLSRAPNFVFNGIETIDAFGIACSDACMLATLDLPEPWVDVQNISGATNVPGDEVVATLQCMLPQGIDGCGYEQPLESMRKAIVRSTTSGNDEFGFRRTGALLAVAIVTDEEDCSYNDNYESIFLPEGNRAFWSDPDAVTPTSAVCWNAGVSCSGTDCVTADFDVNGNEISDPDAAVLWPMSRYVDLLESEGSYVVALDGVSSDSSVTYQEAADPDFQRSYGIGPGCESSAGPAVPPVRIREVVGTISGPLNEFSICAADFGPALTEFGNGILMRLP